MNKIGIAFFRSSLHGFGDAFWKNELCKIGKIVSLMLKYLLLFTSELNLIRTDSFTHV